MSDNPLDMLFVQKLEPGETFRKTFALRDTDDRATVVQYAAARAGKLTRIYLDIWNYSQGNSTRFSVERAELLIELLQQAVAQARQLDDEAGGGAVPGEGEGE